jgi:hypothetical protein
VPLLIYQGFAFAAEYGMCVAWYANLRVGRESPLVTRVVVCLGYGRGVRVSMKAYIVICDSGPCR